LARRKLKCEQTQKGKKAPGRGLKGDSCNATIGDPVIIYKWCPSHNRRALIKEGSPGEKKKQKKRKKKKERAKKGGENPGIDVTTLLNSNQPKTGTVQKQ